MLRAWTKLLFKGTYQMKFWNLFKAVWVSLRECLLPMSRLWRKRRKKASDVT